MIKELEIKLASKDQESPIFSQKKGTCDEGVQTHCNYAHKDSGCQTNSRETSTSSTQTTPIPAPRLSLNKRNVVENPKGVKQKEQVENNKEQQKKPTTDKTLIIGSSILKGIRTSGFSKTHIKTKRGARINRITEELMRKDLQPYKNIISQVGSE